MQQKPDVRPLRTVLFVPGSDEGELKAAPHHGADAVVIDLEEPQTPFPEAARRAAREQVESFLTNAETGEGRPAYFVRVQSVESGQMLRDLRAVIGERLTGVLLPKVQGPHDVWGAEALITAVELEKGVPRGATLMYPILETAQSIRLAYEIGIASPRVTYLGGAVSRFGDIHQAIGYRWSPEGLESLFLRSKVLIDARAAGIRYPISGMWGGANDDLDGLRAWSEHLRDLGYFGMMIGEPTHAPIVNEIFSPSPDDVAYWQDLDRLATEAEQAGTGPILYGDANQGEGHVVHIAHVGSARQNLQWAQALGRA